jgi:gliding motility-associated protein GldM
MSSGKQTPRQKMIGMMYLVLTALLALNVSAEVLNAFIIVDKSLRKTNENVKVKNDNIYAEFNKAYELAKVKVKPWKDKAELVKAESQTIYDYITGIQELIVLTADGKESLYKKDGPDAIKSKDNNNVPSEIMILKQKGIELKGKIETYRKKMLDLLGTDKGVQNFTTSIKQTLNTDDITDLEGKKKTWDFANFKDLPLVAVITILSKLQTDIRNTETDMIGYFYGQIEAGSFKFNKIEAIVNSPTNYVLVGEKYTADVFIAASDSTQDPAIFINGVGKIPVKGGKGVFTGATGAIGIKQWGGVIKMYSPVTKDTVPYTFKSEYMVAAPSISVSPTSMNVFYIGVDNPVTVTAAGVSADKTIVTLTGNGGIRPDGRGGYIVNVKGPAGTPVRINVAAKLDGGGTRALGSPEFRVKSVPNPVAMVGTGANAKGGTMGIEEFTRQKTVDAVLENFDFNMAFLVTGFVVSGTVRGFEKEVPSRGNGFSAEQRALVREIGSGKKIYIEQIYARGPDGTTRNLGTLTWKLR